MRKSLLIGLLAMTFSSCHISSESSKASNLSTDWSRVEKHLEKSSEIPNAQTLPQDLVFEYLENSLRFMRNGRIQKIRFISKRYQDSDLEEARLCMFHGNSMRIQMLIEGKVELSLEVGDIIEFDRPSYGYPAGKYFRLFHLENRLGARVKFVGDEIQFTFDDFRQVLFANLLTLRFGDLEKNTGGAGLSFLYDDDRQGVVDTGPCTKLNITEFRDPGREAEDSLFASGLAGYQYDFDGIEIDQYPHTVAKARAILEMFEANGSVKLKGVPEHSGGGTYSVNIKW